MRGLETGTASQGAACQPPPGRKGCRCGRGIGLATVLGASGALVVARLRAGQARPTQTAAAPGRRCPAGNSGAPSRPGCCGSRQPDGLPGRRGARAYRNSRPRSRAPRTRRRAAARSPAPRRLRRGSAGAGEIVGVLPLRQHREAQALAGLELRQRHIDRAIGGAPARRRRRRSRGSARRPSSTGGRAGPRSARCRAARPPPEIPRAPAR